MSLVVVQPSGIVPYASVSLAGEGSSAQAWTNLAAGPTNLGVKTYTKFDLSPYTEGRIVAQQSAPGVTGVLIVQYGATFAGATNSLGPQVVFDTTGSTLIVGAWTSLAAGALDDVFLRLAAQGGDGVEDPSVFSVQLQLRASAV